MAKYDFAVGSTNPETFPTERFAEAAAAAIRKAGPQLSFYPGSLGHPEHPDWCWAIWSWA